MSFCTKCGNKLKEGSNFCGQCGAKVNVDSTSYKNNLNSKPNTSNNYSMYEVFTSPKSISKSVFNALFGDSNTEKFTYNFVITDKSIIIDGIEHPYEEMSVIYPTGEFEDKFFTKGCHTNFGDIEVQINDMKYKLYCSNGQEERLFYAAIKANERLKPSTYRQELQQILMMFAYLNLVCEILSNAPYADFLKETKFKEYNECNRYAVITSREQAGEIGQRLVSNYTYVQKVLEDYFKKIKATEIDCFHRSPSNLAIIVKIMSESDKNAAVAVAKHNEQLKQEALQRQRQQEYERQLEESGYYDEPAPSGGGFLSHTVSTAAGVVIGNKISDRSRKKQERKQKTETARYMCSQGCKFRYKEHGCPRCKLSNNWLSSPEPDKCGHGYRYW